MAKFDITTSGPVDFVEEKEPVPGYRITGKADAQGTFIGEGGGTFATNEFAQPNWETGNNEVNGEATVTAANGDEMHIHYFGSSPAPNMETGDFDDDLRWEITGGSGQFEGATGTGRLTAHGNINAYPCIVASHLEGDIEGPNIS